MFIGEVWMGKNNKQNMIKIKHFQDYYDNNPRFRRWFLFAEDFLYYTNLFILIIYIIFVAFIWIVLFTILPEDVRTPLISLLTVIISAFLIPWFFEKQKNQKMKAYKNEKLYAELIEGILSSYSNGQIDVEKCHNNVVYFVKKNRAIIHLNFSSNLLDCLGMIVLESKVKGNEKSIQLQRLITRCFRILRRDIGSRGSFYFSRYLTESFSEQRTN